MTYRLSILRYQSDTSCLDLIILVGSVRDCHTGPNDYSQPKEES